jgi:tetratricopeptide (TPR) repeat protein
MNGHLFVSYSRIDGSEFALRLADELEAEPPRYPVWLDQRKMHPSREDWDDQLTEAIQTCRGLLFVMTKDSVRIGSGCKDEWAWALKYKKPVIPVRVDAETGLPFRLSSRQFVDFSTGFGDGLAKLRNDLRWMSTPEGQLRELQVRLSEAERELLHAAGQQPRIEKEMEDLRQRIEAQRRLVEHPQAALEQTDERIQADMKRERQPAPQVVASARAKFVNPPPMTAPSYFQDRYVETGLIGRFLRDDGLRMISVVGRSGIGKTAMVCRLLKALEGGRLPDDLGELAVDGIVYLNPAGMHPINFPNLFSDLCRLLPADLAEPLLGRLRDPQATPTALTRALLNAFPAGRTVVLLDNFEDLVDSETLALTDAALDQSLRTVLNAPVHGVKVIITTRVAPQGLLLVQPAVQHLLSLDKGLPSPDAEEVLRARDADGSLGVKNESAALLAQARERTRGFPRALEALMAILAADRSMTLPELLADAERMPENVVQALVGEAFSRLDPMAQQVMQALAIYAVPVPPVAVDYLLQPFQPAINSAPILKRLVNMSFARRNAGRFYLHQVDRGYALNRVAPGKPSDCDAEPLPFTQFALRGRGADYFHETRTPRETWRTVADLAPQRAEFDLRCQVGDYDAAAQVLFDIDLEYLIVWGNFRLALELHHRLQGHLIDPRTDSASKGNLGICHAALGETRLAVEFHEKSLAIARKIGARLTEANQLRNLGDCYADLGAWEQAGRYCEQAIRISDEISFAQGRNQGRLSLAALHLHADELDAARETAQAACAGDYPPIAADLSLILGIALARQAKRDAASRAFTDAVRSADTLIEQANGNYHTLDTKALALCGKALTNGTGQLTEARATFRAARTITRAHGIVQRVLRLLDALAPADPAGILEPIRIAAFNDA